MTEMISTAISKHFQDLKKTLPLSQFNQYRACLGRFLKRSRRVYIAGKRKAGAAIAGGLDIGNGNVANLAVNVKTVVIECPNAAMKFSASI
ncbi:hypothetical protein KXX47_005939, partial [Aspergillus fumigatus]